MAWSPSKSDGSLGKILGGPGKTSIRAGYGIYNSVIQGNVMAFDEPQPPYGLSYTSPGPPLFATPFITARERHVSRQPVSADFPGSQRSHATQSGCDINFTQFVTPGGNDGAAAMEHVFLTRRITSSRSSGNLVHPRC